MPLTWKDSAGNEWPCKITLGAVDEIRDATDLDLLDADNEMLDKILASSRVGVAILTNILYLLAKRNMGADFKLTPAEFADVIDGDTIERMGEAFLLALADFSPPAKKAAILAGLTKSKQLSAAAVKRLERSLANLNVEAIADDMAAKLDQELESKTRKLLAGKQSGSVPDGSGLTPAA